MLNKNGTNTITANCIQKHKKKLQENLVKQALIFFYECRMNVMQCFSPRPVLLLKKKQ